jgi:outer membrane immunogenic protein
MKKNLLLGVSIVALAAASPAIAAPLAPVVPAVPIYNWTGFYGGGNFGYSWGTGDGTYNEPAFAPLLPTAFSSSMRLYGVIGGGQAGFNMQAGPMWVFGLETDFQGSSEKGGTSYGNPYSYPGDCEGCVVHGMVNQTQEAKILWFGTVRTRAGVLLTPTLWLYGTGGLAYGRIEGSGTVTDTACTPAPTTCMWSYGSSATNVGWTAGGGIEGAIPNTHNWTWKVEYLYIDLGRVSGSGFDTDFGGPYSWSMKVTDNIIRFGINYGFH